MDKRAKQLQAKVKGIQKIKKDVFLLKFSSAYLARNSRPGNFLHLKIPTTILRRPFSIHKVDKNTVYLLFRIRGRGTKALSRYKKGDTLDIIGPLGRGFAYERRATNDERRILVAGGIGVAPLVFLAEKLREIRNPKPETRNPVLLGSKNRDEILCASEFKKLGYKVHIATDNGSQGYKGTVTALLKKLLKTYDLKLKTTIYACGPQEMFSEIHKAVKKKPHIVVQVSFEQFMGCGLGVCCGCVIETKKGYKKVCKDGPVFDLKEVY